MKLLAALLFVLLGSAPPAWAQHQLEWVTQFGSAAAAPSAASDLVNAVAVDADGNAYAAGQTAGDLLGPGSNAGGTDLFVRKYSSAGALLGTWQFGTDLGENVLAIFVDATGVYVGGNTQGAFPGETSRGGQDAFVMRLNLDLTGPTWIHQFGSISSDFVHDIEGDGVHLYVAGQAAGPLGGAGGTAVGGVDAFLLKVVAASGAEVWRRQFGSPSADFAFGVALDGTGIYAVGAAGAAIDGQPFLGGAGDILVRKFDSDGAAVWTRLFGGSGLDQGLAASADGSGGVYVAGFASNSARVLKLDDAGSLLWSRDFAPPDSKATSARAISAASGLLVVAGVTAGSLFPPLAAAANNNDAWFARLDPGTGTDLWGSQIVSPLPDQANGIAASDSGIVVGGTTAAGFLPGIPLPGTDTTDGAIGGNDGFVRQVTVAGGANTWATQFGTLALAPNDAATGAHVAYVVGNVGGALPGQTHGGGTDPFVRRFDPATGAVIATNQYGTSANDTAAGVFSDPAHGVYVVGARANVPYIAQFDGGTLAQAAFAPFGTANVDFVAGLSGDDTGIYVVGTQGAGAQQVMTVRKFGFDLAPVLSFGANGLVLIPSTVGNAISAGPYGVHAAGFVLANLPDLPPDNPQLGGFDGVVYWLDPAAGSVLRARVISTSGTDVAIAVLADATGVYAAGFVEGTLVAEEPLQGASDGFVRKFSLDGDLIATRIIQSPVTDNPAAIGATASDVFVAGTTTSTLPGQVFAGGSTDAFVVRYDLDLGGARTHQLGTNRNDSIASIAIDGAAVVVVGSTMGSLPGQTSAGAQDAFAGRIDTTPPAIAIVAPAAGATVRDVIQIVVEASDLNLASIEILVDGVSFGTSPASPFTISFDTRARPDGELTIVAIARDLAGYTASDTRVVTVENPQLTTLGPAEVWLGLKNSDDVGTKFDLKAEVYRNGVLIGSGQIDDVPGGSSGFNNARLRTIPIGANTSFGPGDTLSLRLYVRVAASSGHRSGTARLWYDDAQANSRLETTIGAATTRFYLRGGSVLHPAPGPGPKKTSDVFVNRAVGGNPFKLFGEWTITQP